MDKYVDLAMLRDVLRGNDVNYHRKAMKAFDSISSYVKEKREKGFFYKDIAKSYLGDQCVEGSDEFNQTYQEISDIWNLHKKIKDYDYVDRRELKKNFILADDRKAYLNGLVKKELEIEIVREPVKESLYGKIGRFFRQIGKEMALPVKAAWNYVTKEEPAVILAGVRSFPASKLGLDYNMDENVNSIEPKYPLRDSDNNQEPNPNAGGMDLDDPEFKRQELERICCMAENQLKDLGDSLHDIVYKGEEIQTLKHIEAIFLLVGQHDHQLVQKYLGTVYEWAKRAFKEELSDRLDYACTLEINHSIDSILGFYTGKTGADLVEESTAGVVLAAIGILNKVVVENGQQGLLGNFIKKSLDLCEFYDGHQKDIMVDILNGDFASEKINAIIAASSEQRQKTAQRRKRETGEYVETVAEYEARKQAEAIYEIYERLCGVLRKEEKTFAMSLHGKAEKYLEIKRDIDLAAKKIIDKFDVEFTEHKLDAIIFHATTREEYEGQMVSDAIGLASMLYAVTSMPSSDRNYKSKGKKHLFGIAAITENLLTSYIQKLRQPGASIEENHERVTYYLRQAASITDLLRIHHMKRRDMLEVKPDPEDIEAALEEAEHERKLSDDKALLLEARNKNLQEQNYDLAAELTQAKDRNLELEIQVHNIQNEMSEMKISYDEAQLKARAATTTIEHLQRRSASEQSYARALEERLRNVQEEQLIETKRIRWGLGDIALTAVMLISLGFFGLGSYLSKFSRNEAEYFPTHEIKRSVEDNYQTFTSTAIEEGVHTAKKVGESVLLTNSVYKTVEEIREARAFRKMVLDRKWKEDTEYIRDKVEMAKAIGTGIFDSAFGEKRTQSASLGSTLAEKVEELKDSKEKAINAIYASSDDEERNKAAENAKEIAKKLRQAEDELEKIKEFENRKTA